MFAFIRIILFFGFCIVITNAAYLIHFIENGCKYGNETLVYELNSATPSIILTPVKRAPYGSNKTCTIILQPPEKHGVVLAVRKVDFIVHSSGNKDFLKIFHSSPSSPETLTKFKFDLHEKRTFHSFGPMTLLYHVEPREIGFYLEMGFEVIATDFIYDMDACEGKFRCDNRRCIEHSLTCDGHNNCGDLSDESRITCDKFPMFPDLPDSYIVVISICVILFLFVLSCTVFCCVKTKNNSYESANGSLEESDASTNATSQEDPHPSGYYNNQTLAHPNAFSSVPYPSSVADNHGGYSNPCYAAGIPPQAPPPYKP